MVLVLIMVLIGLQLVDIVCELGLLLWNSWQWWHVSRCWLPTGCRGVGWWEEGGGMLPGGWTFISHLNDMHGSL